MREIQEECQQRIGRDRMYKAVANRYNIRHIFVSARRGNLPWRANNTRQQAILLVYSKRILQRRHATWQLILVWRVWL